MHPDGCGGRPKKPKAPPKQGEAGPERKDRHRGRRAVGDAGWLHALGICGARPGGVCLQAAMVYVKFFP